MDLRKEIEENNKLHSELQAISAKIKSQDAIINKELSQQFKYKIYIDELDSESENEVWFNRSLYSNDIWKLLERNLITYVKSGNKCKNKRTIIGKHHLMVFLVNTFTSVILYNGTAAIRYKEGSFQLTTAQFLKLYRYEDRDKLMQLFTTDKENAELALAILSQ